MTLQETLEQTPFTLTLSSGFFGFFAHAGFVKALSENGLKPRAYTGASAGAIVSGAAAAGMNAREIEELILSVKREDFWDPSPGLGLVRGKKFERLLQARIGTHFSGLAAPLQIATFDIWKRQTATFVRGDLAKAIRASCAVPFMFHPVRIGRRFYWDGGILDKMALAGVAPSEPVLVHYLQGENAYESYERRRDQRTLFAASKDVLRETVILKNLARSGPTKLHLGPEILEAAYRQTLQRLREPLAKGG